MLTATDIWTIFLVVIGIVSLPCGAFCAGIAKNKGRSTVWWFLCGFFINFMGVLFALLIEPDNHELVRNGNRKRCRFCAEVIQTNAVKCPHCTSTLEVKEEPNKDNTSADKKPTGKKPVRPRTKVVTPTEVVTPGEWTTELKECPFCSNRINTRAKVCRYCQKELPDEEQPEVVEEQA